jgi:hypothetical protein
MTRLNVEALRPLQDTLNNHPVYAALRSVEDLRCFMRHHVYSVWDFMSLIKYLQLHIAPVRVPWTPEGTGSLRYFINQLVLEEESDTAPPAADGSPVYMSHYELYLGAMREVGADTTGPLQFLDLVRQHGIERALAADVVPVASRRFTTTTFGFLASNKPHVVAAALALGREHIIPNMFRAFLKDMGITEKDAPLFHFYLHRHIHLDEDFHAPLSLRMVEELCANDAVKLQEAETAAREALQARIAFWDGVLEAVRA